MPLPLWCTTNCRAGLSSQGLDRIGLIKGRNTMSTALEIQVIIYMIIVASITAVIFYAKGFNDGKKIGTQLGYRRGAKSVQQ